jgi:hypothetical protein
MLVELGHDRRVKPNRGCVLGRFGGRLPKWRRFRTAKARLETRLTKAMIGQTYAILGGLAAMGAITGLILTIARAFGH